MKYGIMILSVLILSGCDDIIGKKKVKDNNTVSKPVEIKESVAKKTRRKPK
jgi:hypothetical protein